MAKRINAYLRSHNKIGLKSALGVIFIILLGVGYFTAGLISKAEQQYLQLGGPPEDMTFSKIIGLSEKYFKDNYFKTAEQRQKEVEKAEQREQARLNLPMNQFMRRTFFKDQSHSLSLAIPRSWEGRFEGKEIGNRLEIVFLDGTSTWPMLDLVLAGRNTIPQSDEKKIVKIDGIMAVLMDRKKNKINSKSVDNLYEKMQTESDDVIKSIKIYKNP